jgi:hypothetical protein
MPPSPLRRTLSAPVVRANAAPYPPASPSPRRSARHLRRRVLADMDWWTVMDGQGHHQPISRDGEENAVPAAQVIPLAEEMAIDTQEMVLNLPLGEQVPQVCQCRIHHNGKANRAGSRSAWLMTSPDSL